jgi:hypothetical protein
MAVTESAVNAVLKKFYEENPGPDAKKARVTDSDRTWQEQLGFILERPNSYPNIVKRFNKEFNLTKTPTAQKELSAKQLKWWETEIKKQAGIPGGFMHVGGKAVDVGVGKVSSDLKVKLHEKLVAKFNVLPEKGAQYKNVKPKDATCFHCY